jgi:hypothetical protein
MSSLKQRLAMGFGVQPSSPTPPALARKASGTTQSERRTGSDGVSSALGARPVSFSKTDGQGLLAQFLGGSELAHAGTTVDGHRVVEASTLRAWLESRSATHSCIDVLVEEGFLLPTEGGERFIMVGTDPLSLAENPVVEALCGARISSSTACSWCGPHRAVATSRLCRGSSTPSLKLSL